MCRSWRHERFEYCSNCLQALEELPAPCQRVIPITLYSRPSLLRNWLKYYKPGNEEYHPEYGGYITVILRRFLRDNDERLRDKLGPYTVVSPIPSSSRQGQHPLMSLLTSRAMFRVPVEEILNRGSGTIGHRVLSEDAFIPRRDVSGDRVLLIDDVYTTGARAQSAASVLAMRGASVVGILVVARRIDPEFNLTAHALWSRQRDIPYDFRSALSWLA
jgi:hypothetical protein